MEEEEEEEEEEPQSVCHKLNQRGPGFPLDAGQPQGVSKKKHGELYGLAIMPSFIPEVYIQEDEMIDNQENWDSDCSL